MAGFGRDVATWWGGIPPAGKLGVGIFAAGSFGGILYFLLGSVALLFGDLPADFLLVGSEFFRFGSCIRDLNGLVKRRSEAEAKKEKDDSDTR